MRDPNNIGMEYNSNREHLTIPEYGRNVQKMIQHAKTIENPGMRQAFVEKVIDLMQQMHPQSRSIEDYRERLWKHVFRIADYELDVEFPYGERPTEEEARKRPDTIPYPVIEAKYRHYGHNVQQLIKKALEMPEGPKREGFVSTIGSYMKLAYKTWNKEHYVSDEIIKGDLERLSGGKVTMDEDETIDNLTNNNNNNRRRSSSGGGGKRSGGSRSRGGRSGGRRKR